MQHKATIIHYILISFNLFSFHLGSDTIEFVFARYFSLSLPESEWPINVANPV